MLHRDRVDEETVQEGEQRHPARFALRVLLLCLGALLLLIYPFVLVASLMGLAAEESGPPAPLLSLVSKAFLWGTVAYPAIYVVAVVQCLLRPVFAVRWSSLPLAYLGVLAVLSLAMVR